MLEAAPWLIALWEQAFEQHADSWPKTAFSAANALLTAKTLASLHLIGDVLEPIETFRKAFESDSMLPHTLEPALEECKMKLRSLLLGANGKQGSPKSKFLTVLGP